jgi:hypothetical protein
MATQPVAVRWPRLPQSCGANGRANWRPGDARRTTAALRVGIREQQQLQAQQRWEQPGAVRCMKPKEEEGGNSGKNFEQQIESNGMDGANTSRVQRTYCIFEWTFLDFSLCYVDPSKAFDEEKFG